MGSKDRKYAVPNLLLFAFLDVALIAAVYYFILTALLVVDLAPRLQGREAIAGMCALAIGLWMIWFKKTGHGGNKLYSLLTTKWWFLPVFYFSSYMFICILSVLFQYGKVGRTPSYYEPFYAAEKILIEAGYCTNKQVNDQKNPFCEGERGGIGGTMVPGGIQDTVFGVSDPKVQQQIGQVYIDKFFKTPDMKHMIVYFDPDPASHEAGRSGDTSIEMWRK